jgi:DNA-nicking Smr family endonuclease
MGLLQSALASFLEYQLDRLFKNKAVFHGHGQVKELQVLRSGIEKLRASFRFP